MQPSQPLLVFPGRALRSPPEALNYVWATGPPRQVEAALAHSSLAPSYLTKVADFSRSPDVANITRTYGFLRIVASAIVLLALVAMMLYLSGRERSQLVTSAFLRRMGVSQARQAWSVALESCVLVAVAAAVGLAAAVVTAGAIIGHVDPLSQYSPAPVTEVPWWQLLASGLGVVVVAGLVGSMLTLVVKRTASERTFVSAEPLVVFDGVTKHYLTAGGLVDALAEVDARIAPGALDGGRGDLGQRQVDAA